MRGVRLAALLLASLVSAQERVDAAALRKEVDAIFARPANTPIDAKVAVPALDELLEKHKGKDLGELGYVPALREYLVRDYAKAVELLDVHMAKHATIESAEHRVMAGRVYLNGAMTAGRAQPPDDAKMLRCAERAALLYTPPSQVTRLASTLIQGGRIGKPEELRAAIVRGLARSDASPGDLDAALIELYAPAKPKAAAKPAGPATLAPFKAVAMSGKTIDLADYRGKVVLVDFWATWCPPCMKEMPHVVELWKKHHTDGLEIIGISLDKKDAEQAIKDAEKQHGMEWEQIYDGGHWQSRLAVENEIHAIPATFLIDKQGKVRHARLDGEALAKAVAELLAEK